MRDVVPVGFFLLAVAAALPYSAAILAAALYLGWVACCFMEVIGESFVGRQQGFGPVLYWPANGIPGGLVGRNPGGVDVERRVRRATLGLADISWLG